MKVINENYWILFRQKSWRHLSLFLCFCGNHKKDLCLRQCLLREVWMNVTNVPYLSENLKRFLEEKYLNITLRTLAKDTSISFRLLYDPELPVINVRISSNIVTSSCDIRLLRLLCPSKSRVGKQQRCFMTSLAWLSNERLRALQLENQSVFQGQNRHLY